MKTSSRYALALLSVAAGTLGTAPSAHAARMFAIGSSDNVLRSFDSGAPGTALSTVTISGLAGGEFAAGIDVRPSTGELYAVTTTNRLYVLNPVSGAATAVGAAAFSPSLTGSVGMDISPLADRVRLVDAGGISLRVNPITGAQAAQDTRDAAGRPQRRLAGRGPGAGGHAVARGDGGQRHDADHVAQDRRQRLGGGDGGRDRG